LISRPIPFFSVLNKTPSKLGNNSIIYGVESKSWRCSLGVRFSLYAISSASAIEFVGVLLTGTGAQAVRNIKRKVQK
jgi:chemotaxis response regulator CheB